jgi:UDP-GlcNAc:undecaprenyl-phosphate/decaprenyl-phosphate GlcNAc-1-phosphate transferase
LRGDMLVAAVVGLWVVGAIDDAFGGPVRGIGGHVASLLRGRPATGLLKLAAGVTAAVVLGVALGGGPVRVAASVVLIAVATNVWNALDVVPGRALKAGIVALVPLLAAAWQGDYGLVAAAVLGGSLGVLPFDLAERGMLGDAGSNPLGLVIGTGMAGILPTPWVVVAAAAGLALQLAAETVTISRLIDAIPPVRWFDRLGRKTSDLPDH